MVHEGISNDFLLACLFHQAHTVDVVIMLHLPIEVVLESGRCLCLIWMEKYIKGLRTSDEREVLISVDYTELPLTILILIMYEQ